MTTPGTEPEGVVCVADPSLMIEVTSCVLISSSVYLMSPAYSVGRLR